MTSYAAQIESILFFKGEPVSVEELAHMLGLSHDALQTALSELAEVLERDERGIRLMHADGTYQLVTAPAMSEKIQALIKEDLQKGLSKAALETLSIILYYGPITRARIDYIRGVNSSFSIRALSIRGLIERAENKHDQRSFVYTPSMQLLSYLGVTDVAQLPDYTQVQEDIMRFEQQHNEESSETNA